MKKKTKQIIKGVNSANLIKFIKSHIKIIAIFVIIVVVILILPNKQEVNLEKAKAKEVKRTYIEEVKTKDLACVAEICKDYVGFRYDAASDKCYCYDAEGNSVERTSADNNAAVVNESVAELNEIPEPIANLSQ